VNTLAASFVAAVALSLAAIITTMASLPDDPPLAAAVLVALSAVLFIATLFLLRRGPLAWGTFFAVARGVAIGAAVYGTVGILVILRAPLSASQLTISLVLLVLTFVEVPVLVAYSVARYQPAD